MIDYTANKRQIAFKAIATDDRIVLHEFNKTVEDQARLVSKSIIDLRDKCIRDALIQMGWTPPEGK